MRTRGFRFAIAIAGFISAQEAGAGEAGWTVYSDDNHGCLVDFPSDLFSAQPFDPGNPQRFSGPNQNMYFQVLGVENNPDWTPSDIRRKYLNSNLPGMVVHQRTNDRSVILSGYRGENSFYTKVAVSEDLRTVCILDINYPLLHKKDFNDIVTRMASSFTVAKSMIKER